MSTSTIYVYQWTKSWALAHDLKVWAQDQTGSTNTVAKNDISEVSAPKPGQPAVYLTENQTGGRGRGDHVWSMPPGSSLISSWSFAVLNVPQPIFSPLVGLALYEACSEVWPEIPFNLKAPNDLFIGDKKTAGILIETVDRGVSRHTVIGLGLNVTAKPANIDTATCLSHHTSELISEAKWAQFLNAWFKNLSVALAEGERESLTVDARSRLLRALNLHPFLKEPLLEVDEKGQLISASRTIYWHEL